MSPDDVRLPGQRACVSCEKPIRLGARLCRHCGTPLGAAWTGRRLLKACAGVITVLSLVFAFQEGHRIWSAYRIDRAQLAERLASAGTLIDLRDFEAAWGILTTAQQANPRSRKLREVQTELAFHWMMEGFAVPAGWIPGSHEDGAGAVRADVADLVHSPLVVASVFATGEARAEIEALVAWANFLRGRALRTSRRDLGADFRRARDLAPHAFTPNLLLGYWQAGFENDPGGALASWQRALDAGTHRPLVRNVQVSVLGQAIMNDPHADRYREALLQVLAEMQRTDEPFPSHLRLQAYQNLYLSSRGRELHVDAALAALNAERQLAILEWVNEGFDIRPGGSTTHFATLQLVRAHLLEHAGRPEEALRALVHPDIDLRGSARDLEVKIDEALQRLTAGVPHDVPERDGWRAHLHHLNHAEPGDARFDAAMQALDEWSRTWEHVGDKLLGGQIPPALDAAVAALERQQASPTMDPMARAAASDRLRALRFFRGRIRAETYDFAGGIAELEALASDPETPADMRAETFFALARAYTYSSRAPHPDMTSSAAGQRIYEAYLTEGMDRLAVAIQTGFNDWDRVEKELPRLRELSEYEPFSLAHGRVPRQPGQ
jgi:hypothetical protein